MRDDLMTTEQAAEEEVSDDLMSTAQAAKLLKISKFTLDAWCSAKRIAYYKVGGARRFKREDLNNYIEKCRVEAAQ